MKKLLGLTILLLLAGCMSGHQKEMLDAMGFFSVVWYHIKLHIYFFIRYWYVVFGLPFGLIALNVYVLKKT